MSPMTYILSHQYHSYTDIQAGFYCCSWLKWSSNQLVSKCNY